MKTEPPQSEESYPRPTILQELRGAGLLTVAAFAFLLFVGYWFYVWLSPLPYADFGQLGDSFWALTALFNALAFAALIATVVLQSRELRESRRELAKQARAQEAWANAAAQKIALTRQLEAIRIRPFIKVEWHQADARQQIYILRVRNVGLGVAVLVDFEIWAGEKAFGTISSHGTKESFVAWKRCLLEAAGATDDQMLIYPLPFNDLNCALAPGEHQTMIQVTFQKREEFSIRRLNALRRNFRPVIRFQAADGKVLSTANQFSDFNSEAAPPST